MKEEEEEEEVKRRKRNTCDVFHPALLACFSNCVAVTKKAYLHYQWHYSIKNMLNTYIVENTSYCKIIDLKLVLLDEDVLTPPRSSDWY